jgi:replicative DNA helicase
MKDFQKLQDAASICFNAPLYICDTPNMKLLDLRAVARRMHSIHGVKIIFTDYIGLIRPENEELPMHEQQSIISKSLKSLARELNIPIVVLCQLARSAEGQVPNLAELRGSGSIEQDADAVILIHGDRKENHSSNENYNPVQDRKLILAKQRNGPVGDIEVAYIANYTKFENKARE